MFLLFANTILVLHVSVVLFVIGGLVIVLLGNSIGWQWVNHLWFRLLHLATILYVVGQAWFGATCPLTTLESWLRKKGGSSAYASSFIEYWFQKILFYEAPTWVFTLAYSAFALVVAYSWWRFPPVRSGQQQVTQDRHPARLRQ